MEEEDITGSELPRDARGDRGARRALAPIAPVARPEKRGQSVPVGKEARSRREDPVGRAVERDPVADRARNHVERVAEVLACLPRGEPHLIAMAKTVKPIPHWISASSAATSAPMSIKH